MLLQGFGKDTIPSIALAKLLFTVLCEYKMIYLKVLPKVKSATDVKWSFYLFNSCYSVSTSDVKREHKGHRWRE